VVQLDPVPIQAGHGREPGRAPTKRSLIGSWLGRRPVILTRTGDGTQAGMARAPEAKPMADQVAEGEQDRVEPL